MSRVQVNAQAPAFVLRDFNDKEISLSSYRGKKHVLLVLKTDPLIP
jgi:peroxiredoxin